MRKNLGFTLIEILVVIAIISAILGGISLMIGQAMKAKDKSNTTMRVNNLGAALERIHEGDKLGMYPPTRMENLVFPGGGGPVGKQLGAANETNAGIETVYVALRLKGINVTVAGFEADNALANLDDDKAAQTIPDMMDARLFEYLDTWGNPLVYISARDYKNMKGVEQYMLANGSTVKVQPQTLANGEFARPDSFQLFSLGPDGEPGTDDDIKFGQ